MRVYFFVFFSFLFLSADANITLPAVLSSNMVLQQKSAVKLWGWGNPTEKVYVTHSWNTTIDSTVVTENAKWMIAVNTPSAGGPYTITIKGYNQIVLENILIGEVWVCSGQSNMEYNFYWGSQQIKEELPLAAKQNIRFLNIPRTTAETPQEDGKTKWSVCDSNTLKSFSAIGYFFGKKLNEDLNVPIGLINASWGGTPAEVWTPAEKVSEDSVLQAAALKQSKATGWPIEPGFAYNGMIAPLTNFSIAGVIWYQGESNTGTATTYQHLFTTMIKAWRQKWAIEFPFYYVQLAPFTYDTKNSAALLREAQTKTLALTKTGMVVTTDLADDTLDIHPKNKKDVGLRLAKVALTDTYGQTIKGAKSPLYKSLQIVKDKAIITFDNIDGLMKNSAINGFFVAGENRIFYPAQANITKDSRLQVWSKKVSKPTAVRYAFSNTAVGNLFSKEGLPVAPFRTDDW
ncbi:MAG TPA: sialate O-acetylesterase [Chitinophagaceae bacterium]|nr:sialate O-acetylesterase [Chitinophagaceae bacterium]